MSILNSDFIKETVTKIEDGKTFVKFSGISRESGEEGHYCVWFTEDRLSDKDFMRRYKDKLEQAFMPPAV